MDKTGINKDRIRKETGLDIEHAKKDAFEGIVEKKIHGDS